MHFNIYSAITLLIFVIYGYSTFSTHRIIKKLTSLVDVPRHWSGRINVKELSALKQTTDDHFILQEASKAIFLLKLGKYVVYGGLLLFVILMLVQA